MKIGIWGGTFDPIHNGHLAMMKESAAELQLDKVVVLPAYLPPHKTAASSPEHRLAMLQLACKNVPLLTLDTQELARDALSYSVVSCKALRQRWPNDTLFFCMGADSYEQFHSWHAWQDILGLVKLAVVTRPSYTPGNPVVEQYVQHQYPEQQRVHILQLSLHHVSSTHIREQIRLGEPYTHLVPPAIGQYIQENALYI